MYFNWSVVQSVQDRQQCRVRPHQLEPGLRVRLGEGVALKVEVPVEVRQPRLVLPGAEGVVGGLIGEGFVRFERSQHQPEIFGAAITDAS